MEKTFITNRKGQRLAVVVRIPEAAKGLAFVMHGLSGCKDRPQIVAFAGEFVAHSYTTVAFDVANTFGESDGLFEDATITNYYEDLEDVITWAKQQPWFVAPFVLLGHSLGGFCTAFYAEQHPDEVRGLAPLSTVVSGAETFTTGRYKDVIDEWRRTGWFVSPRPSHPGMVKRLKYAFVEDAMRYDLMPGVGKLTMPVFLAVGDRDESTPPATQQRLFDAIPGKKELHVLPGSEHTFRTEEEFTALRHLLGTWLDSKI